ncbi:proline racemase family protein [Candidatus Bathyarchaeota archaeon]|nr:proline racemase family protein [Candidatus Bathyarchaeota archaeon]
MRSTHLCYVVDTHTEGEPTRILLAGFPRLEGKDLVEKREFLRRHLDWLRTSLLFEPRGHRDQFGALVLPSEEGDIDYKLIFMDGEGYLDMCGHATMGVTTALIELGFIQPDEPTTKVTYETVSGVVEAWARVRGGCVEEVSVIDVPSFHLGTHEVRLGGEILNVDVAYGGNYYAIVEAESLKTRVRLGNLRELVRRGIELRDEVSRQVAVSHPDGRGIEERIKLAMITDKAELPQSSGKNIVVFGRGQFDRSPCATGTAARLATMYVKGLIEVDEPFIHESIINTTFRARILRTTRVGGYEAIIPEITGRAFITQLVKVMINPDDPLKYGFNAY